MANVYLRGPKRKITPQDYDDSRCEGMVTINGKPMSIDEFRKLNAKGKKKNHIGLGIWVKKKP